MWKWLYQRAFFSKGFTYLSRKGFLDFLPDEFYLKRLYFIRTGRLLDLNNPVTFNEKLQWLKLNDRQPRYIQMVDKYEVKKYAASRIGEKYIIPTLGIWDEVDEINFDMLPNRFVLKSTHDSGGVFIVRDKTSLDIKIINDFFRERLKRNFFFGGREWPYKYVKPRIIAEQFMEDNSVDELIDYKFYCFNGEPKFLYIAQANFRDGKKHDTITYLDLDWKKTEFYRSDHEQLCIDVKRPASFDEMLSISRTLSSGIPFIRVDLYNIDDNPFFSELTFFPGSGFGLFQPVEFEKQFGSLIILPELRK